MRITGHYLDLKSQQPMIPIYYHLRRKLISRPWSHTLALAFVMGLTLWYWDQLSHVAQFDGDTARFHPVKHSMGAYGSAAGRPTIGKITMLYGNSHEGMYDRVLQSHERHAMERDYEFIVLREKLLHGLWSKLGYLLSTVMKELEKPTDVRLQWLFWFDCDIVLLNAQIPLELFLPPYDFRDINILVTNDHNGLNSGAFFIRVSEWSVQFLIDVMALPTYQPEIKLKYSDQSAMEHTLKLDKYRKQTMFVPQRWFNAYRGPRDEKEELIKGKKVPENTVKRGDMQLHFAGKETTGIKTYIPFWLNVSERREWEIPLWETTYEKEVSEFWNVQRRNGVS